MTSKSPAGNGGSADGIYPSSRLERVLLVAAIAVASIGLGYLFFTQLWWKLPPDFGCRGDFARGGLCFFLDHSVEEADASDALLKANILESRPGVEMSVPIGWATQASAPPMTYPNHRISGCTTLSLTAPFACAAHPTGTLISQPRPDSTLLDLSTASAASASPTA